MADQPLSSLSLVGILSSPNYSFRRFRELYEEDDSLKVLALRVAIVNCFPDATCFLLDNGVIWNYHIEANTSDCECINCSGKYYNCKELAFRLSYDTWSNDIIDVTALRLNILDIQKAFLDLEELTDKEIFLFLYRHLGDAKKYLTAYPDERIENACKDYPWILNRINNVPLKEFGTKTTATKTESNQFYKDLLDDEYFEKCKSFVENHPNDLRHIFAQAVCARNCRVVQNLIDLGILDYNIGNPFNYFVGSPGSFKPFGTDKVLISMLYNYGFRPDIESLKKLIEADDYKTIDLILPLFTNPISLKDLENYREQLFENIEDASKLVYHILSKATS